MTTRPPARRLAVAALPLAVLAGLGVSGCSAATSPGSSATASAGSPSGHGQAPASPHSVHLTAYSDNDGPTQAVIVTGAIGDYGQAVSVHPDGTVDPDHSGQLSLRLAHGSFRLDIARLDHAFVTEMAHQFPTDKSTCSGSVAVTQSVPVVPGSGAGAYRNVSGSFMLTLALDEVDKPDAAKPCDGTSAFLAQAIVISGAGALTF